MKLLVIDGNSIINRAFYGIKLLSTKNGQFTNGIYGFLNILIKNQNEVTPDAIAVAFDLRSPTFRHELYEGYKQGRHAMPDELASQMPILKELLGDLGIVTLSKEGFEADDILGTLSSLCKEGDSCYILTGDRDSLQLIRDNVTVLLASTNQTKYYTKREIEEEYEVSDPKELIEIKAIMGDSSDKIPGVAGIGQKGAVELISKYHSIDYIYENIDSLDIKPKTKEKLISSKDMAFLSRTLGTIKCDVPLDNDLSSYRVGNPDTEKIVNLLSSLEMFKMIEKLGLDGSFVLKPEVKEYPKVEFDGIITEDAKALYYQALKAGNTVGAISMDTSLAGYILNPSSNDYSLNRLSSEYGCENTLSAVSDRLFGLLKENDQISLLEDLEIPLSKVLASMESEGFLVDKPGIEKFGKEIKARIEIIQKEIFDGIGYEFNLNSPKQLGEALFEKLGLPAKKKTKSGYSTNAEVLEELSLVYPIVNTILEYRMLSKLQSTYCDGLLKVIGEDGRIHSTFNQKETRTGRLSSTEPNLQNIPIRKPLGSELRRFFLAKDGYVLIDADYSQIELRVLASIANDTEMINAFKQNEDIHSITASQVFNVPLECVNSIMRSRAKAVNFGIVYGIGAFSLAKDIGVSRKEADAYINGYLEHFSGVDKYMTQVVSDAKDKGYVKTLFERRRYLPELKSNNHMVRAFGERVARNMPIQGTAADIIKIAMIKVYDRLEKENLDAKLIMQVHDELIVEASNRDKDKAMIILKEEMENACKLQVPLLADVHIGNNWLEAKG